MNERVQAEHDAAQWIAKRDTGPWTQTDADALAEWLKSSAGNRVAYYRLNGAWQEAGRLKALVGDAGVQAVMVSAGSADLPVDSSSGAVLSPSNVLTLAPRAGRGQGERPSLKKRAGFLALAASLVLAVGGTLLISVSGVDSGEHYSTRVGGLQAIAMSDGSKVTLNTDSEVRLVVSDTERRVELKHGEAYFEVAKDPQRPFVVVVNQRRVIAVGTAFSVRRQGDDLSVLVSEGKVRVDIPGKPGALLEPLSAGAVMRTANDDVLLQTKSLAEIEKNLSWREGLLTFRDTPLAEAVAEFNRYNTRKIVIADSTISAIKIGGIFRANNIEPFVRLLQDGFPVNAASQDGRIVLTAR